MCQILNLKRHGDQKPTLKSTNELKKAVFGGVLSISSVNYRSCAFVSVDKQVDCSSSRVIISLRFVC